MFLTGVPLVVVFSLFIIFELLYVLLARNPVPLKVTFEELFGIVDVLFSFCFVTFFELSISRGPLITPWMVYIIKTGL